MISLASMIVIASMIFSVVGVLIFVYRAGWRAKDGEDQRQNAKDLETYIEKRNAIDNIERDRGKYSRSDILSGKPLRDHQNQ